METLFDNNYSFKPYKYKNTTEILKTASELPPVQEKQIYLFMGTNGSGKSTIIANLYSQKKLTSQYLNSNMEFEDNKQFHDKISELIKSGKGFVCEIDTPNNEIFFLMGTAWNLGYKIYNTFIHTNNSEINVHRVEKRAKISKEAVNAEQIRKEYTNSLSFMVDNRLKFQVYDNSLDRSPGLFK